MIFATPIGAYAAALAIGSYRRRRERGPGAARRRRAHRRAVKRLKRAAADERPEGVVSRAIRGFAADYADAAESGMTTREAERILAVHFPLAQPEAMRIMIACDKAMFSAEQAATAHARSKSEEPGVLIASAAGLLEALKKSGSGRLEPARNTP